MTEKKMQEPITYFIDQSNGTVDLTLTDERFIAKTQGKGLIDKPRTIDIPLSDLKYFSLMPTIAPQNLVSYTSVGDHSYDAEFVFSYREGEQLKKKRVFVNSRDESFKVLLETLRRECPSASLLHLESAEAQKQMGVLSASKSIYIIIGLLVGVPLVIALIVIISKILGG
jgi:hypothetical protein